MYTNKTYKFDLGILVRYMLRRIVSSFSIIKHDEMPVMNDFFKTYNMHADVNSAFYDALGNIKNYRQHLICGYRIIERFLKMLFYFPPLF